MTPRGGPQQVLDVVAAGAVVAVVIPSLRPLFAGAGTWWLLVAVAVPVLVACVSVLAAPRTAPSPPAAGRRAGRLGAASGPWSRLLVDGTALSVALVAVPADAEGRSALGGLRAGAAHLLTSALPLPAGGPELGVVMVAAAVAAGVAAEAAVRTRSALAPVAAPVVLYGAALAVGAGGLPAPTWDAAALLAAAAVTVVVRRLAPLERPAGGPSSGPRVAGGAPARRVPWAQVGAGAATAAAVGVLALPLGGRLPGAESSQRYDLRAALRPAGATPPGVNPLVSYAAVYDGPVQPELSVRTSGADPTSVYWRLDVLDHYTGTGWVSTATLLRGGTTLPPGPRLQVPTTTVVADVHLDGPATYLPAPDRPVQVSVPGLDVAASDGVLAVAPGARQPRSYRVRAEVPDPGAQALLSASPAGGTDPGSPPLPYAIQSVAASVVARVSPAPFARLTAISSFLTGPAFVRHPPGGSPIGSGAYQAIQLLHDHDGSAEQYAAAFALLARAVGFDTRLAVGYLGGRPGPVAAEATFTSRDLAVWPEVNLRGIGWLPWPTVPATGASASRSAASSQQSSVSQAIAEQRTLDSAGPPPPAEAPPRAAPARSGRGEATGWLGWLLVAVAVAAAAPSALVAAKAVRRYRQRRAGDARAQVSGAWECVMDRLAERGVEVPPSLSAPAVAVNAVGHLGPALAGPIEALAALVDAARYNRRVPVDTAAALAAWEYATQLQRALRRGVPARRRARGALSLAPWSRTRRRGWAQAAGVATTKIRRNGRRVSPVGSGG
ncbi:DUF3488 domain-containing protein [Acidiferrimicrobium sp. IK]|uniref:DUF3488 domain-containing protein n=1 Tax=Acidiferrimicrobium sp. IK TaxID=2871700 RepID=UPI0021CAF1BE|nr:DUF3488 domain-containing protein [Acidiferrimicrobium sp. IK]MCU4185284.1 DUF3488 domain-containing protein [Acidiferrimicrobium sp. IK]